MLSTNSCLQRLETTYIQVVCNLIKQSESYLKMIILSKEKIMDVKH